MPAIHPQSVRFDQREELPNLLRLCFTAESGLEVDDLRYAPQSVQAMTAALAVQQEAERLDKGNGLSEA